jgi:transposase
MGQRSNARSCRSRQPLPLSQALSNAVAPSRRWERRRKSSQALALRSRIVLKCAEGRANKEVAAQCGVSAATVGKWRRRFCELRLDGLSDDPRPGRPPTITAKQVEEVLVATLECTPENATHWSRAKMAERSGLSESTIGRIWRAFGLAPHRSGTFKLSNDPLLVEKVYDIVGLYLNPPEAAVVLSVDEKSQVQALARSQPAFPMMPGMCERRTHDHLRHGTSSLFAAFDIADGSVISSLHRRHRTIEFKKFLQKIDSEVPEHLDVHLVCDNYGTHKSPAILRWLEQHPRFPHALHADVLKLDQSSRAVVRLPHRRPPAPIRSPQRPSPGKGHPRRPGRPPPSRRRDTEPMAPAWKEPEDFSPDVADRGRPHGVLI